MNGPLLMIILGLIVEMLTHTNEIKVKIKRLNINSNKRR